MRHAEMLATGAAGKTKHAHADQRFATAAAKTHEIASAEAWFADGEHVGYDSNAQKFAPKQWLTAAIYHWGPYYLKQVKEAMAGTWKSSFYYGSIKDGMIDLAPYGRGVSAKTRAAIGAKRAALVKGSFYEFAGPLYDQSGKLRVPKGKRLNVTQLYGVNWLVKGIIGSPKG